MNMYRNLSVLAKIIPSAIKQYYKTAIIFHTISFLFLILNIF